MSITTALLLTLAAFIAGVHVGEWIERRRQARRREAGLNEVMKRLRVKGSE